MITRPSVAVLVIVAIVAGLLVWTRGAGPSGADGRPTPPERPAPQQQRPRALSQPGEHTERTPHANSSAGEPVLASDTERNSPEPETRPEVEARMRTLMRILAIESLYEDEAKLKALVRIQAPENRRELDAHLKELNKTLGSGERLRGWRESMSAHKAELASLLRGSREAGEAAIDLLLCRPSANLSKDASVEDIEECALYEALTKSGPDPLHGPVASPGYLGAMRRIIELGPSLADPDTRLKAAGAMRTAGLYPSALGTAFTEAVLAWARGDPDEGVRDSLVDTLSECATSVDSVGQYMLDLSRSTAPCKARNYADAGLLQMVYNSGPLREEALQLIKEVTLSPVEDAGRRAGFLASLMEGESGLIGGVEAYGSWRPNLISALRDSTQPVGFRTMILAFLARLDPATGADVGMRLVHDDPSIEMRRFALSELAKYPPSASLGEAVIDLLHRSLPEDMTFSAIRALERHSDERSLTVLADLANRPGGIGTAAATAREHLQQRLATSEKK